MPHLDAEALETDPEGCAFLRAVVREARPRSPTSVLHLARAKLGSFLRQARRREAQARIREALAASPILDLSAIAEGANLSCRKTRALVERLELQGIVLVHTTRTGTTLVHAIAP